MRYLMTFSYDGSNFFGYQKQPKERTVQDEIEKVLSQINNKKINISASGRTDSKVHAINQKAHFDSIYEYDLGKLKHSMNKMLPDDIYIKDIKLVDDNFHARFNVEKKIYEYKLNMGEYNPIERNYIYQYGKKLNIDKMKEAINYLIGTHNFKSFVKTTDREDFVRTIYDIKIEKQKDILTFTFIGNGFLRYMVRNIVGTLVGVGEEKINPDDVKKILNQKDRKEALLTFSAVGLYLKDVIY